MGPSALSSWTLLIARTLNARGIDAAELFRRAKLPSHLLDDPNARFPLAGMQRLWALAAAASGDPCFGLEVGRAWRATTFHALGYVALASRTLREALEHVARYSRVVSSGAQIELRDSALAVKSRLPVYSLADPPDAPVLATLAALAVLSREMSRSLKLRRVTFTRQESACRARLREFFDCPLEFGARADALVFRAADLDAPLPTANPVLVRTNEQLLAQYDAKLESGQVADRVRARLARSLPAGEVGQETIARSLHLSLRSMQRKLRQEGVSFRQILDDTRRRLAEQYARDSSLSASEIAYLLGFSELSSFSRAARRWRSGSPASPFARISLGPGA